MAIILDGTTGITTPGLINTGSETVVNLTTTGTTTLGDASGDALTINSSAVSIPNGLNFDSNTFVIDAANNNVGIGTASPAAKLDVITGTNSGLRVSDGTYTGTFVPSSLGGMAITTGGAYPLIYYINGSERMRIDSSGNVGIGTSSPAGRLGITTSDALVVDINSTAASGGYMRYAASGTVYGYIGTSTGITGAGGTNALAVRSENSMMFATGGSSERMRIDSSGNLLVNTTSQFGNGVLNINTYRGGAVTGLMTQPSTNANYDAAGFRNSSGSYVGYISCTASATSYVTSSDYRLKDNIAPMTGALDKVSLLKPCTYTWKLTGEESQGFIAHELAEVVPDCVTGEKDAVETYTDEDGVEQTRPKYQGIDTSFLVATLTAAIQEQQAIITAQADTISAMEARLTALEAK